MQKSYAHRFDVALPGMIYGFGDYRAIALTNSVGLAAQTFELTSPASPTASATYRLQLTPTEGFPVVADFKTDSAPTQSELLNGMFLAIVNSPLYDSFATSLDIVNNKITMQCRAPGVSYAIAQVAATPEPIPGALITATQTIASGTATPIPYGRFVSHNPLTMSSEEATLPTAASGLIVRGVTISTHANVKDNIGPAAKIEYKPLEVMNVLTHTLGLEGVWVETDAAFGENATLYIETQRAAYLGCLTTVATNNMALPGNVQLIEPAQRINLQGKYAALVYLG